MVDLLHGNGKLFPTYGSGKQNYRFLTTRKLGEKYFSFTNSLNKQSIFIFGTNYTAREDLA
jgi:hypothetical protein